MIIGVGGVMIWNSIEAQRRRRRRRIFHPDSASTMNAHAIFSGVERRVTAKDFRFGRISAVFGGVELDFHDADIDGDKAEIEVNAIFGGVEIRVPDTWHVEARNQTALRRVFDGRGDRPSATTARPREQNSDPQWLNMFGGVEVKN